MTIKEFVIDPGEVSVQWVVNAFANNLSTASEAKAAVEYYRQGIISITVSASIASGTEWFKILDGNDVMLGPCALVSGIPWSKTFRRPIYGTKGNALKIITSGDFPICCVIEGYTDIEPDKATEPNPADEVAGVSTTTTLSWTSTPQIVLHNIYINGDFVVAQAANTYSSALEYDTEYTWRIDSGDGSTVVVGDTWSFTTESAP